MLPLFSLCCALLPWLVSQVGPVIAETAPVLAPRILGDFPHDQGLFTQGLFLYRGRLYESTGLRGQSRLLITELASGEKLAVRWLAPRLFAEGADLCGDEVVQLTWTSGLALRYDPVTLGKIGDFRYQGQGWGIACHGQRMVTSDGSARLTFRDPNTFEPLRTVTAVDQGQDVRHLNELEWVDDVLLANVWKSHRIAVIDPDTGVVRQWLDLTEAVQRSGQTGEEFVLNGIAWDADQRRLYVTGKGWSHLYWIDWPGRQARLGSD
ncbi:Glutamine cyclotransferase [Thiorhodovibrio winogradskyi]|uniref:Glutamine cyclotransferase n=1 Tax=Thiorhodovibrio winogradskyi TaxID=77007 RepID=A0ABZ0SCK2_9GAMM|nr:glutaminyl-peptide cyclotransferase [Thiorhodovibrio winogradskyi]